MKLSVTKRLLDVRRKGRSCIEWDLNRRPRLRYLVAARCSSRLPFHNSSWNLVADSPSCLRWRISFALLAVHDGHCINHSGECARVPATCDVSAQAPSAAATRRGGVRRTPGQRSSIRRLGALRARHGCIAVRLEGSPGWSKCGVQGGPCMLFQRKTCPSSRSVGFRAIPFWEPL